MLLAGAIGPLMVLFAYSLLLTNYYVEYVAADWGLMLCALGAVVLFGRSGMVGIYRHLKATIEPLQRETAIRIARETIRKRMRRR